MYLVRYKPYRDSTYQLLLTEDVTASYAEKHRTKKVHNSPIGRIREVEATGPDTRYLYLRVEKAIQAKGGRGHSVNPLIKKDQSTLQQTVREMTANDLAKLDEYDAYIEAARQTLAQARDDRESFVKEAWKRGERISIRRFLEQADARQQNRTYK